MPAHCAEISKVTSGGGNWILRDLGPLEAKAFDRKYSSCIRLWNTTMKNWFRHHLENFISFPLIDRFAGIRRVLTELEADHWKHRSNYTVTLSLELLVSFVFKNHLLLSSGSLCKNIELGRCAWKSLSWYQCLKWKSVRTLLYELDQLNITLNSFFLRKPALSWMP